MVTDRSALVNKALADVLKGAYVTEGFTLPKLAKATNINERTLQRVMSGLSPITLGSLEAIAKALNLNPQKLMDDAIDKADRDQARMSEASGNVVRGNFEQRRSESGFKSVAETIDESEDDETE